MAIRKISLAYAAGFIDGDGSVFVQAPNDILVCAANSHREVLEPFKRSFGGSIGPPRADFRNPSWRPMNTWVKAINKTGSFLKVLEPHLILKKQQAKLGLELVRRKSVDVRTPLGRPYGWSSMSTREREEREKIKSKISKLNNLPCTCPHVGNPSLEYLAGLFDAEGCVTVTKARKEKTTCTIFVNVSNRCWWILEQIKLRFGGSVGDGHGTYQWQASARIAERFLRALLPSLVLKQERAKNALKLYDIVDGKQFRTWAPNRLAAVYAIRKRAMELNRKGVA